MSKKTIIIISILTTVFLVAVVLGLTVIDISKELTEVFGAWLIVGYIFAIGIVPVALVTCKTGNHVWVDDVSDDYSLAQAFFGDEDTLIPVAGVTALLYLLPTLVGFVLTIFGKVSLGWPLFGVIAASVFFISALFINNEKENGGRLIDAIKSAKSCNKAAFIEKVKAEAIAEAAAKDAAD